MDRGLTNKSGAAIDAVLNTASTGNRDAGEALQSPHRSEDIHHALLRAAAHGAGLGLAVLDVACCTTHSDEGWLDQIGFGSDAHDIQIESWLDRIHPEDRSRFAWVLDSLLIARQSHGRVECRLLGGDGHWRSVSIFLQLESSPSGEPARIYLCLRDTTREHAYREQLRHLAQRIESDREADRTTLARELHDELGQLLTAIRMDADRLLTLRRRGSVISDADLVSRLGEIKQIAGDAIKAVQRICHDLRPPTLAEPGLVSTVRAAADAFESRTGIRCHALLPQQEPRLDAESCRVLSRALHEALTNIARHAHASEVRLALREEPGMLELEIADNGRGLPPGALSAPGSIGLFGLRERAQGLGGETIIGTAPGGGTLVALRVPLRAMSGDGEDPRR